MLASYGVSDEALLNVITGTAEPEGRLPFELPSTMDAVAAQLYDVPNDSASPLFAYGAGLSFAAAPTEPTPAPTPGPGQPTTAPPAAPAPGPVPTPGSASGTTPAPAPAASGRGGLAMTGFEALPWVAGGLTLVALGVVLTLVARRRKA